MVPATTATNSSSRNNNQQRTATTTARPTTATINNKATQQQSHKSCSREHYHALYHESGYCQLGSRGARIMLFVIARDALESVGISSLKNLCRNNIVLVILSCVLHEASRLFETWGSVSVCDNIVACAVCSAQRWLRPGEISRSTCRSGCCCCCYCCCCCCSYDPLLLFLLHNHF